MEMQKNVKGFTPLSESDLAKTIAQIKTYGKTFETKIRTAAINAIFQSLEHGRVNYAQDLFDAVPKAYQRGLVVFFEKHGRIKLHKDQKTKVQSLVYDKEKAGMPKPEEGKAGEFVSHITESPLKPKRVRPSADKVEVDYVPQMDKFIKGLLRQIERNSNLRNDGKEVEEKNLEVVKRMEQAWHDIKVELGIISPEVEVEEPDLDAIMEENRRLKEQLAGKTGAAPAKPEQGQRRRTIQKAA